MSTKNFEHNKIYYHVTNGLQSFCNLLDEVITKCNGNFPFDDLIVSRVTLRCNAYIKVLAS